MMYRYVALGAIVMGFASIGCISSGIQQRHYYVLQAGMPAPERQSTDKATINGLVRVRDLNADSTYDKQQIIVRHSPFELTYQELNVWAVKPHRMISDEIARALLGSHVFSMAARELGEQRPNYVIGGDLHAIEISETHLKWYVHLALSLNLTRFDTGDVLWVFHFDERKAANSKDFSQAVRGLSELLAAAIDQAKQSIQEAATAQPNLFSPSSSGSGSTRKNSRTQNAQ